MTIAARALSLVLEAPDRPGPAARALASRQVAVLAAPPDAVAACCSVALMLAGSGVAIAATWGGDGGATPAGAMPSASREAARLADAGFDAVAAGRLVRVTLDADDHVAAIEARELAARGSPVVFALAGPRSSEFDDVISGVSNVVAIRGSGTPAGLVDAAVAEAEAQGRRAARVDLGLLGPLRSLATLGFVIPPGLAAAMREALR